MTKTEFVVSACLAGRHCRYDGGSRPCAPVAELARAGRAVLICPESLSGLPVPRPPCEQKNGRVYCQNGDDVTEAFQKGATTALARALASGCRRAILKGRSPSCGYGEIYDGSFTGKLTPGNGVFAQKLLDAGFQIWSEDNLPENIQ